MTNRWTRVRSSITALAAAAVLLTTCSTAWSQEQIAPEPPARRWLPGQWAESVAAGVAAAKAAGGGAFNPAAGAMPAPNAAAVGTAPAQTASEIVLHSFESSPPKGAYPRAGLIRDSAGNFYGTTVNGGTVNQGVVYKMDPAGTERVLYSFTGGTDGGLPYAGVIRDSAGNLYGTTVNGGASGKGVVFKLEAAGQETVLYSFTGGADGANPYAGVIMDLAGNLYGTTYAGGTSNAGVVYKLDTAGNETVLYTFTGGSDGGGPYAGVIRDSAGNFYGTTYGGGTSGAGVVYKLDPAGTETVLYTFTNLTDGGQPYAGVIRDSDGNLYGTTVNGNLPNGDYLCGVVYKLDPVGTETVLHTFGVTYPDGYYLLSGVVRDSAGNLYGTTEYGGTTAGGNDGGGAGTVYKLDPAGNETLYSFSFTNGGGYYPAAGVILDAAGNLDGTTSSGGPLGLGAVYKFDTAGQETVLYGFQNPVDGGFPNAGLVGDSAGNLYGATNGGGTSGAGVVFSLAPTLHETVLYTFTGGADGGHPYAGVIRDAAGNLYGTAVSGGPSGAGVVFKVSATGQETVLYAFTGGADGGYPYAGVIRDSAGNLYGTTSGGGTSGAGVVFKVSTTGQETVLYSFTGGADGGYPYAGVIRDSAGNLYGTASGGGDLGSTLCYGGGCGVVFKVSTSGQETVLYAFTGATDGSYPSAGVIRDSAGNLYGTASAGGDLGSTLCYGGGCGVVFKVSTSGQETVLYAFTGATDGSYPYAGVVGDSAGNLYGTASGGGTAGAGVVYEVNAAAQETVLYSFCALAGCADGADPTGVFRDPAGNLFGTAYSGGKVNTGVVFAVKPQ